MSFFCLQVLQELPAKREHIIHCEMTPEQKALYRESMQKSKRFLAEEQQFETMPDDPPKKGRGRPPKKPVTKQAENSSNILMDLRKAANHPMLFRRLYDDKKIAVMSKDCLKEPEFSDRDATYIEEDMSLMSKQDPVRNDDSQKVAPLTSAGFHSRLRATSLRSAIQVSGEALSGK